MNLGVSSSLSDRLADPGDVALSGVRMLWMVDPRDRTVAVFRAAEQFALAEEEATIDGGDILPGWKVKLSELFAKFNQLAAD